MGDRRRVLLAAALSADRVTNLPFNMKSIYFLRHTFTRQREQNDCGVACLAMILRYTGRYRESASVREKAVSPAGLSLLDMKRLAHDFGLQAKCVSMDITALRTIRHACILHTTNPSGENHFIVCFAPKRRRDGYWYPVADPARYLYDEQEALLQKAWKSKTALYFEGLVPGKVPFDQTSLGSLLGLGVFPKELWTGIVLLNSCTVLLGLAISLVLQRGLDAYFLTNRNGVISSVVVMLLVINLFKNFVVYTRQKIMIVLNTQISGELFKRRICRRSLTEIQRIQHGLSALAAVVLSDGLLVLLILSGMFYIYLAIAVVNAFCLACVAVLVAMRLPGLCYDYARLNELSATSEKPAADHGQYLAYLKKTASKINKANLTYETIGTVAVITTFVFGLRKLQAQAMSYATFMAVVIMSYFLTALMLRISQAIPVISEGGEAARN